jgi:hypothetical protein
MNKVWITGLTLAGVAGSAGAAVAGISSDSQASSPVEAQGFPAETSTTEAASRTATYQVGAAGTVTLTADDSGLTVVDATAGEFWTLGAFATPAAHIEVPFNDAAQQVTFIADLVNGEIVVSVTNVPVPGATTTSSIEVTQISGGGFVAPAPQAVVPAPQAATPVPQAPAQRVVVPVAKPTAGQTSKASSDDESHSTSTNHEESHEESHDDEDEGHDD